MQRLSRGKPTWSTGLRDWADFCCCYRRRNGCSRQTTQVLNTATVRSPQSRPNGGVQLDLEPRRAQVFVDGVYTGLVDDFTGYYQHLTLPAGRHGIEVFTPGYLPMIFEVMVVPDRTITYRRSLEEAPRGW